MAGRRPKDRKHQQKLGDPGKKGPGVLRSAANIDPVAADPNLPPAWLDQGWQPQPGEALRQWQALVPEMRRLRMFTVFDVNLFGRYCLMMALWLQARSEVEREGMVSQSAKGGTEKAKAYMQLVELSKELRAMESEFGGSPNSRRKISVPDSPSDGRQAALEAEFGPHMS